MEAEIGRGGMGIVYLASDEGLGRKVALKVVSPELGNDLEWVKALRKEAAALASIRSPHVVQVHAFGRHEGACFFVMEYVRGQTVRDILAEHWLHRAQIPLHRALTIISRLAAGLDAVHETGIVHRDLKPDNVVIEEDTGRPVLVDFGLAVTDPTERWAMSGGTPLYMAPEQTHLSAHTTVSPRTDVYAFGCLSFELLCGRPPFDDLVAAQVLHDHAHTSPPAISQLRPELAAADAVFRRALAKDPAERHATCSAFAQALMAALGVTECIDPPPPSPRRERYDSSARRVLVVDDDPAFRRFATRAVQLAFYEESLELVAAATGAEALVSAWRQPPHLVLLDFDMPGLDGVGTLSRLRSLPQGDQARVVVMSAKLGEADRWRFSVLGVGDFVAKPIELEQLIETISSIAARTAWPAQHAPGHDAAAPSSHTAMNAAFASASAAAS
ncbi:serine/threonine protein kinase [Chondromyces apiculatus DSM 436]|uniref:Serine/threonine protein kinase n=1 Tax=Chondromyces apiculatus DSM 436 TaxID=1192034 RepID=A0A017TFB2_9BACT|nr:serine/threonine protein kinase [Chondromyces apiculatus DSM 436]